ncbi:MAG: NAD-dependent phenylacetaldehyde dehydrogenase, partial [Pseudomonas sp.]
MSDIQLLPAVVEFLARPHGHFIDGQYLAAEAGPSIDIHDPSSGAVISRVAEASEAEVARAVVSARQ